MNEKQAGNSNTTIQYLTSLDVSWKSEGLVLSLFSSFPDFDEAELIIIF